MEPQGQVLTAAVDFEGESYSASYYVEHNIINAIIGGLLMSTPLTSVPAEKTVQGLLMDHLLKTHRSPSK